MDHYAFRLDLVHQAVGANDQLSEAWIGGISERATSLTQVRERVGGVANALRQCGCEGRGVAPDVLDGVYEIVSSWLRPDYFASHLESRFLTCS